jgi:hypothetical protein
MGVDRAAARLRARRVARGVNRADNGPVPSHEREGGTHGPHGPHGRTGTSRPDTSTGAAWSAWAARSMWYASATRPRGATAGGADAHVRASDAERAQVTDTLSKHYGDGRLDAEEFDQRMSTAMTAKTRGELVPLLADLPSLDPVVPHRSRPLRRLRSDGMFGPLLTGMFAAVVLAAGLVLLAVSPAYVPAGFVLLFLALVMARRSRRERAEVSWHRHLHVHDVPHEHGPKGPRPL